MKKYYKKSTIIPWLALLSLGFGQVQIEHKIYSGAAGNASGVINAPPGQNAVNGSVSFTVGQIIQTNEPLSGTNQKVELGFWNTLKRRPEDPALTATYDYYPDRVILGWSYDANKPQATTGGNGHSIWRGASQIRTDYSFINKAYTDNENNSGSALTPGTEYTYTVKGSNAFGYDLDGETIIGKTSSNGTITGFVETTLGTDIPFVRMKASPNWGTSLFLDGIDDYAAMAADSVFDMAANNSFDSLTTELWFNTPDVDGTQVLLNKGGNWKLAIKAVGSYNYLSYSQNGIEEMVSDASISTNAWNHVAMVKKESTAGTPVYQFYVNGSKILFNTAKDTLMAPLTTANTDSLFIGKDGSGNYFRGNIDEFRIWSVARDNALAPSGTDSTVIKKHYDTYVPYRVAGVVVEPTLVLYTNMDVGSGNLITNTVNQGLKGNLHGESDLSYWHDSDAPAYATAFTDLDGAYEIINVNYSTGTNMTVMPSKEFHVFNPTSNQTYLSDANPVRNNVNFTVTNLQSISGYVKYDTQNTNGASCGIQGVRILQNGTFLGTVTDADGYYLVEVEPGGDMTVKPDMPDRDSTDYIPYSASYTNVITPQTRDFTDRFSRNLRGKIAGGTCQLPLGPQYFSQVIATSATNCFADTVYVDGAGFYEFRDMPIMEFQLSIVVNTTKQYTPAVPNLLDIGTFFVNAGVSHNMQGAFNYTDSTWTGTADTVDFTYYAPVTAEITDGFTPNILGDNFFNQNERDTIDITVYEGYYNGQNCPLKDGWVKVRDYVGDLYTGVESDTLQFNLDSTGIYRYAVLPGQPNTSPDGAFPYKKKFEVLASDTSEQRQTTINDWAVVMGHKPISVDFTTTAPEIPFLILRRPPGDASSASFGTESSSSFSLGFSVGASVGFENETKIKTGVDAALILGGGLAGVGTQIDTEVELSVTNTFSFGVSLSSSTEMSWESSASESFGTSGIDESLGAAGDVFVGGALNILYGTTDVLALGTNANGDFVYEVNREIIFVPNGFATTFQYSRGYINDYLVPTLEGLVAADSTKQADVDRWNQIITYADSLRDAAVFVENRSFSGGAGPYTNSVTESSSSSITFEQELEINNDIAIAAGFEVAGSGFETTSKYSFGFKLGASQNISNSQSTTVEYTLEDDDYGDDYTVDILTDPVYGTPVFKVIAGSSSCPYEEWTNTEGTVVTLPQDEPFMQFQSTSTATNVLPDGTAEFRVLLRNESTSQSQRTYHLSIVAGSNPRGADIFINGQQDPIPYTLDYLATDTVTVTVRRPQDTDFYEFPNLRLKFAPSCEANYAGVTDGYQASFTVNFARPCSEVEFYNIGDDWVLNNTFNDTLPVTFTGYDLNQSYFEQIELQYSPISESNWYTIPEAIIITDSLRTDNRQYETTYWSLASLDDGVYDLRFKSVCLNGALVNLLQPRRGTVDRIPPLILGNAEPTDQVLNQNDEMAFNFTEEIDPTTVEKINFEILDPYGAGEITAFDLSSNENRVVAEFTLENRQVENHDVTMTFHSYQDLFGNVGDTVRHTFKVNRNPISWSVPELNAIAVVGNPTIQTVTLNNIGSNAKAFDITGLPEWLTVNTPDGTLNPGGNWDIDFTISPDINVGDFVDTVFAQTPEGDEPLAFRVASMCEYPDWDIDKVAYEHSMNIVAKIAVLGTFSEDKYDRVTAVVDGEYRGYADLIYDTDLNEYRAYLTVYSNVTSGEYVEFHIWDRTECLEWWQTDQTLAFTADGSHGAPNTPLNINATGEVAQEFIFPDGWDWMSFNLETTDMSIDNIFGDLSSTSGDRIVGQDGFAQYSSATGWVGTLTQAPLDKREMYQVNLASEDSVDFIGVRVGADTIPIVLDAGWNWLSYLPNLNTDLGTGLATLSPDENDLIKSQTQFAQYVPNVGWVGNLKRLRPSEGYKIQMAGADTLTYPYLMSGQVAKQRNKEMELPEAPWDTVQWREFEHSMTVIALIENNEEWGINDPMDAVVVMKDGEIRGFARPEYVEVLDAWRLMMTVFSNESTGESLELKFWDADMDITYSGEDNIAFNSDDILGNVVAPWLIRLKPLTRWDKGFVPDSYVLDQNYPNPFNPTTRIGFGVPEDANVSLTIYNIMGQEVRTLVKNQFMKAGYQHIVWNARTEYGDRVPSGIYFMVMHSGSFRQTKKMVLLK